MKQGSDARADREAGEYRQINVAALAVACAGLVLPLLLAPLQRSAPRLLPRCASQAIFGRPCPMCGLTRALAALERGDAETARTLNPLALPVAALLAAEIGWRLAILLGGRRGPRLRAIVLVDAVLHTALAGLYLGYCAAFLSGWI
jgi:hypothetical protein